ncbi:unnamed protein product, partial [Prorocentrum cordatum]
AGARGADPGAGTTSPMQTPPSPGSVAPSAQLVAAAAPRGPRPASPSPPLTARACAEAPLHGPVLTERLRASTSPGRLPSPRASPRGAAGEPSCARAPVPTQVRPPRQERPSLLPWELGLDGGQDRHLGSLRAPDEIVLELAGDGVLDVPLPQRCLGPISVLTGKEFVVGRRHQPELHRVAVAKECLPFLSRDHFSIAQVGGEFRLRSLTDNTMWLVRDGDSPLELRRGSEALVAVGDRIALVTGGDVISSTTAVGACQKLCWHVRLPSVLEGSGGGWRGAARGGRGPDGPTPPRPGALEGFGTPPSPGALLPRLSDLAPWSSELRGRCTPPRAAVPKSAPPLGLSGSPPPRGWAFREERHSELWSPAPRMLPQTQEATAPPGGAAFSPAPRGAAAAPLAQLPEDTTARFGSRGEPREPGGSLGEPDWEPLAGSFLHRAATKGPAGEGSFLA